MNKALRISSKGLLVKDCWGLYRFQWFGHVYQIAIKLECVVQISDSVNLIQNVFESVLIFN